MKTEFSVGLADKVCAAWDNEGGTPVELNSFRENDALVRGVLAIIRGEAVIKPILPTPQEAMKFANTGDILDQVITDWVAFWQKHGFALDVTKLVIPAKRDGFDRLLVIPKGLTTQKAFDICSSLFPTWKYTGADLDEAVPTNDRDATNGDYAIWVRERVEADQELKNLSANDLTAQKIAGITLMERLVYEAKYFTETGKHLDIENYTLCSGSRDSDGSVPRVCFRVGEVSVRWCSPGDAGSCIRARQAVS